MTAIQTDAATETFDAAEDFDAADAFAKSWGEDAQDNEPSENQNDEEAEEAATTEGDEDVSDDTDESADEQDEDGAEEGDDEPSEKRYAEDDDLVVKHVVDGEEREFKIGDLKRLAGQEASITRKGQEVATKRKALDDIASVQFAAHERMVEQARKRYEPFSKVDFALAATQLDPEEYKALRSEAQAAYEDLQFFETGLQDFGKQLTAHQQKVQEQAAEECLKVLSDPETGIKGWSRDVFQSICSYAVQQGLHQDVVRGLVDPAAYKLLHKAMLYDRGVAKVAKDKAAAQTAKAPKKIVKGTRSLQATKAAGGREADAMKRLRSSGSRDDAADAFLASWGV